MNTVSSRSHAVHHYQTAGGGTRGASIAAARKIDPISWTVEEFLLIRSDKGHDLLDRWPLQQRQYALAL